MFLVQHVTSESDMSHPSLGYIIIKPESFLSHPFIIFNASSRRKGISIEGTVRPGTWDVLNHLCAQCGYFTELIKLKPVVVRK